MKKTLNKSYSMNGEIQYKQYRNSLNKIIQKTKYNFYKQKIEHNANDLKQIYKIISEATDENVSNKKNKILQVTDDDTTSFCDKKKLANYCNSFFSKIGMVMSDKIKLTKHGFHSNYHSNYNSTSSMFLTPVSDGEIIKCINTLKNNCSPGIDKITSKLIKQNYLYFLAPLKYIINLIFTTGKVPSYFKIAIITPIFKTGDPTSINNYRPISVINNFAKIFEMCLKNRLQKFLTDKQILSKNQFAFYDGRGTVDALHELTSNVNNCLENNEKCLAVFLDLAKAFDTVSHSVLLEVLRNYGVRGVVLNLFASYLSNRTQMVKVDGELSDPLTVQIGIPQGTVLGPLLFITYMNSLTELTIEGGRIVSYADDTVVIFRGSSWESVKNATKIGIANIMLWLETFKLTLNIEKTKYMAFSLTSASRPNYKSICLTEADVEITEVNNIRYLGVVVDNHLRWGDHISKVSNNIRKLIYKFYNLREILSKQLLIVIYKTLVESLIRYGLPVWGGLYNNNLKQLNVVQNYILKIIYKKNRMYPTSLLYTSDIFDVRSLYILSVCRFVHRNSHIQAYVNHSYRTRKRENQHLILPNSKTSRNQRSLHYLAPRLYNTLPNNIKTVKNVKKFSQLCSLYIYHNLDEFLKTLCR